jgi:hypothetical protein
MQITCSSLHRAQANPVVISKRHSTTTAKNFVVFVSQLGFKVHGADAFHLQHATVGGLELERTNLQDFARDA